MKIVYNIRSPVESVLLFYPESGLLVLQSSATIKNETRPFKGRGRFWDLSKLSMKAATGFFPQKILFLFFWFGFGVFLFLFGRFYLSRPY